MTNSIEERLRYEHPGADIAVSDANESGPYKVYEVVIKKRMFAYNPDYPENNSCLCGHAYYRHFDPYEDWAAVGCKYCECGYFAHGAGAERLSPFARMQRFGQWAVALDDYLVQWEMFGHAYYPTLQDYLGATPKEWTDITNPPNERSSVRLFGGNSVEVDSSTNADDDEFVEVL